MDETDQRNETQRYSGEVGEEVVASARRSLIAKRPGWRPKMAAIALTGALLFTSACGVSPIANAVSTPEPQPTATLTVQEKIEEANLRWADFLEIGFPLRSYGLEPRSAEELSTKLETPTIVANYTDLNIDSGVACGIFDTIDQLRDDSGMVRDMRYEYKGKMYRFKVVPREYVYRGMSIIPNADSLPEDMKLITAQTMHITSGNGNQFEIGYVEWPMRVIKIRTKFVSR